MTFSLHELLKVKFIKALSSRLLIAVFFGLGWFIYAPVSYAADNLVLLGLDPTQISVSNNTTEVASFALNGLDPSEVTRFIEMNVFSDVSCLVPTTAPSYYVDELGVRSADIYFSYEQPGHFYTRVIGTSSSDIVLSSGCLPLNVEPEELNLSFEVMPEGGQAVNQPMPTRLAYRNEVGDVPTGLFTAVATTTNGAGELRNFIATSTDGQFVFDDLGYSLSGSSFDLDFEVLNHGFVVATATVPIVALLPGPINHITWSQPSCWTNSYPTNCQAGAAFDWSAGLFDTYGNRVDASSVTLSIDNNSITSTSTANGSVFFNDISILTAGTSTLKISTGGVDSAEMALYINAGAFNYFNLDRIATSSLVGQGIAFTISARDRFNNLKADYDNSVWVITDEQSLVFDGTCFVSGVCLQEPDASNTPGNLVFRSAGRQGISFYDSNSNIGSDEPYASTSIVVSPDLTGIPYRIVWKVAPVSNAINGATLPDFSVNVVDAYGNQASSSLLLQASLDYGDLNGTTSQMTDLGSSNFIGLTALGAKGMKSVVLSVTSDGLLPATSTLNLTNNNPKQESSYPIWLFTDATATAGSSDLPYKIRPGLPAEPYVPAKLAIGKQVLSAKIYAVGSLVRGADKKVYQVLRGNELYHIKTLKALHAMRPQIIHKITKEQLGAYRVVK